MKYTGLILAVLATLATLILTTYSVLVGQAGMACIFAMMTIMIGDIAKIEYNELEK